MIRSLTILAALLVLGCGRGNDKIDLVIALKNTQNGEYKLVAIAEDLNFASFQQGPFDKKQYYYEAKDRDKVLTRIADAVLKGREAGHEIHTIGLYDYIEE